MFFVYFPEQFIVGRPFYSKENASAPNFAVQKDDKFATYSTFLIFFSLLYEYMFLVSFLEQFVAGRPFYRSKEKKRPPRISRCKRTINLPRMVPLCFFCCTCFLYLFLNSILPGGASAVRKMRPPRISPCKRTINLPRTVPLCFSLLYMFFVFFLKQFIAGRTFYRKKNAFAQNFAV